MEVLDLQKKSAREIAEELTWSDPTLDPPRRTTSIASDEPRAETPAAMRTRSSPAATRSSQESWWAC